MNIIFLINSPYPRYAGGIETWLFNVSEKLSNHHEITIISHERKDFPIYFGNISSKIAIHKFRTLRSYRFSRLYVKKYILLIDLFFAAFFMGKTLRKVIETDKQCYIVALDSMFCVKGALIGKASNHKSKLISSVRGPHAEIYSEYFKGFSKLLFNFERKMLLAADCIWANGYDTKELLQRKGFDSVLIKNGIDYDKIINLNKDISDLPFLEESKISIVSVGSLLPIKGIYELIDSIQILKVVHNLNVELIFIGKGEQSRYSKYALQKGVFEQVHFMGHYSEPMKMVKGCKITACLSGGSGMSMSTLESMATGIPIIAWDSPVYQQFNTEYRTMLLVKENDANELALGIVEILKNYDYYLALADNAKEEAQKYDWQIVCEDILKSLENDC